MGIDDDLKKKFVKIVKDGYKIGNFDTENSARFFLAEFKLENIQNLWMLLANAILDLANDYFSTVKDQNTFLWNLKVLTDSMNTITYMRQSKVDPFNFSFSIKKIKTKFYVYVTDKSNKNFKSKLQ